MNKKVFTSFKGQPMVIEIRCDDECKKGHDTFSITGTVLRKNKCNATHFDAVEYKDRFHAYDFGGAIHETILKVKPEYKLLVDLHLSDGDGVPLYAVENGFFHFCRDRKIFQNYLRLTDEEVEEFYLLNGNLKRNQTLKGAFIDKIEELKPRWKEEAEKAKRFIEAIN